MRHFLLFVAALSVMFLMGCGSGSGSGTGARGIATRQDTGQPLANVAVSMREIGADDLLKENGHTATVTTNAQGRFTINIVPGKYEIGGDAFNQPGADLKIFQYAETINVTANNYTTVNAVFVPYDAPTAQ